MQRAETTFAIEVETQFSAAHAILLAGERETLHGHDWRVVVSLAGDRLDGEELLCDFHAAERMLAEVVAPFVGRNLNDTPPFDRINPTAEALARHIADELDERLAGRFAARHGVHLEWVRVTEAPRCVAVVRRGPAVRARASANQTHPTP
jgi:6-pyruvoyltetrahydropterin/6-carboxytetrahydropterin synthase